MLTKPYCLPTILTTQCWLHHTAFLQCWQCWYWILTSNITPLSLLTIHAATTQCVPQYMEPSQNAPQSLVLKVFTLIPTRIIRDHHPDQEHKEGQSRTEDWVFRRQGFGDFGAEIFGAAAFSDLATFCNLIAELLLQHLQKSYSKYLPEHTGAMFHCSWQKLAPMSKQTKSANEIGSKDEDNDFMCTTQAALSVRL